MEVKVKYLLALAVAGLVTGIVAARAPEPAAAQPAHGTIEGRVPADGGFALVVWGGGQLFQLEQAARNANCQLASAWFTTSDGRFVGYVYGAPGFVNAEFLDRTNGGNLASGAPLIIVCASLGRLERAPIQDAEVTASSASPPLYTLRVVSALPNGCHTYERTAVNRTGETIEVQVLNRVRGDVCTQQFGTVTNTTPLGSDFVSGRTYTVRVNDVTRTFVAR